MATRDNLLSSVLHGTAWRAAVERRSIEDALAELRGLAAGRDDVLAEAAGVTAGSWMAWPEVRVGHELVVAGLLVMAAERLDYDLLAHWVRVGYERGLQARRPVHGDPLGNGID
ncbi:hypothetical protein ACFFOM_09260 [Microlunatus capsulatus]|uniref:Uncharacterized protein n=1 Tax=Microlunatus capsulatus TaxID=99117 RepID=A0ABS4ZD31_9ACTN|nr:hypothetical protein [Microlunatus capsulatus]MBP2418078.1 hypothetical protein [Microlunatus capsulatus]